jgi:hypothetical protein
MVKTYGIHLVTVDFYCEMKITMAFWDGAELNIL